MRTIADDGTIGRLIGRATRRQGGASSQTPFTTEFDSNRELAQFDRPATTWFFVSLPIFMLLYAIFEKMHVR